MFPVINELNKNKNTLILKFVLQGNISNVKTGLDFKIKPHLNIKVMKKNQSLENLTSNIIKKIGIVIKNKTRFDSVHGDTTSSLATALASYYNKVKVAYIEASV